MPTLYCVLDTLSIAYQIKLKLEEITRIDKILYQSTTVHEQLLCG